MTKFNIFSEGLIALVTGVPIIGFAIKQVIDNWGATDLEKLRLSNFQKFQIALTKYISIGIAFVAIVYLLLTYSEQFKDIEGNMLYGMLAIVFIIFIVAIFLLEKLIRFLAEFLSLRYEYHIVNDQGVPVYRIIKLSVNNSLLVESDGIEEFLDSKENWRYKKVPIKNKFLEDFYRSKNSKKVIIGLAILSIGFFFSVLSTHGLWQVILYMIFIMAFTLTLIFFLNYFVYKRLNERSPENSVDSPE